MPRGSIRVCSRNPHEKLPSGGAEQVTAEAKEIIAKVVNEFVQYKLNMSERNSDRCRQYLIKHFELI